MSGPSTFLDAIPLFATMDPTARQRLAERCNWHTVPAQHQIIDRDSPDRDVYFVTSGIVRIVNFSLSGREISFDDLEEGAFFGEIAALDRGVRSASVIALAQTGLAVMPPAVFLDIATGEPSVGRALFAHLAATIRRSTERIMDLSTLAANNRVHAEILRLARRCIGDDGAALISPMPVHADIASRVGTTRETVARVISELSRLGLVERKSHSLHINDVEALQEMVDEVRGST